MALIGLRTQQAKIAEAEAQEALRQRLQPRYERDLRREIRQTMEASAKAHSDGGFWSAPLDLHEDRVVDILNRIYQSAYDTFGGRVFEAAKSIRKHARIRETKEEESRASFWERARGWIAEWAAVRAADISATTRSSIRDVLLSATQDGLSIDQAARRITKAAPSISRMRAAIIARTELHAAATNASIEAAKATGLRLQKEWVSVEDARTRLDHVRANGQVVAMDGRFTVGTATMSGPGDPSAPPEQIINCRCVVTFEPMDFQ